MKIKKIINWLLPGNNGILDLNKSKPESISKKDYDDAIIRIGELMQKDLQLDEINELEILSFLTKKYEKENFHI